MGKMQQVQYPAPMGDLDIRAALADARKRKLDDRTLAQRAADLAQELLPAALKIINSDERTLLSAMARLTTEEKNLAFIRELCGSVFHVTDPAEQVANLHHLIAIHGGVPPIFSTMGKLRFKAAAMASRSMQGPAIKEVQRIFRSTFGGLTLPTQVEKVAKKVREGARDHITLVLNPLVPEVFGRHSAERYYRNLEAILTKQDGVGIVIQPWRLCPGLSPYSPAEGAKQLADKLKPLLKLSLKGHTPRPLILESGTAPTMNIVAEGLRLAMAAGEFRSADVAFELPAYLKDSPALLRDLTEWANSRVSKGAAPLKVLLVKGSHLSEEQQNAWLYGRANSICQNKAETETRYKQLVHQAISAPEKSIVPIIGTHNIFDISYALLDWGRSGRNNLPVFCFISGLANHVGRVLGKAGARILLTTGVTTEGGEAGFEQYLLDLVQELGRPGGFLAGNSALEPDSQGWSRMRQSFLAALSGREEQTHENTADKSIFFHPGPLDGITDRAHIDALHAAAAAECERRQEMLPLLLDGEIVESPLQGIKRSPSAPGMEDYRFVSVDFNSADVALQAAASEAVQMPPELDERRKHLLQAARLLQKRKEEFIALLVRDAGCTLAEADSELNHALDAFRFYEQCSVQPGLTDGTQAIPLGLITVASGRINPLLDAVEGIAAAWVMGNAVLYKPSPYTILLAQRLTALLAEAGFSSPRLQMVPCVDNQIARKLMTDARVNGLIYSGNAAHTLDFSTRLSGRPLLGGSMGCNTIYISSQGDWKAAIRDICATLFRRAGQSPQNPHLLLVHAEVYDNQLFTNALKDAIGSLTAQPGWVEGSSIGPMARPLTEEQKLLLTCTEGEESWLVQPGATEIASQVWTPGVRMGVQLGSAFALASHNVPVIGLVRMESTDEAARTQRRISCEHAATLYSRDPREAELWLKLTALSNASVNCLPQHSPGIRPTSCWQNAIPQRGGRNFITALCQWQEVARPQHRGSQRSVPFAPWETLSPKPGPNDSTLLSSAADSIAYWWEHEFGKTHTLCDTPALRTTLSYKPLPLCIRVEKATSDIDLSIALMAALKAGCDVQLSTAAMRPWMPRALEPLGVIIGVESREEFESRFSAMATTGTHVRDTAATDTTLRRAANCRVNLCAESVLANGRLELLRCMREVVLSTKKS